MQKTQEYATKFENVCAILEKYENDPHKLVTILQEVQAEYSYLPEDIMNYVAIALGITPGTVFGVATFYTQFTLEPKGKYVIKVCDGTACHVRKSTDIINTIENELGLGGKKQTSDDMLFTLEAVACIGCCSLAPVMMVNADIYGHLTKEKTLAALEKYKSAEEGVQ